MQTLVIRNDKCIEVRNKSKLMYILYFQEDKDYWVVKNAGTMSQYRQTFKSLDAFLAASWVPFSEGVNGVEKPKNFLREVNVNETFSEVYNQNNRIVYELHEIDHVWEARYIDGRRAASAIRKSVLLDRLATGDF